MWGNPYNMPPTKMLLWVVILATVLIIVGASLSL